MTSSSLADIMNIVNESEIIDPNDSASNVTMCNWNKLYFLIQNHFPFPNLIINSFEHNAVTGITYE